MEWFALISSIVAKLPVERWLIKPRDSGQALDELEVRLRGAQVQNKVPASENAPPDTYVEPLKRPEAPTNEETARELKRRLAKELYRAELDLSAKLRIAGKPCDCLDSKHTLGLEATAEELISHEPGNPVYFEIIDWIKQNRLKLTIESISSGKYDDEYPVMAAEFREFRKRISNSEASSDREERAA